MGNLVIGVCIGFAAKRIIRHVIRLVRKTGLDKKRVCKKISGNLKTFKQF